MSIDALTEEAVRSALKKFRIGGVIIGGLPLIYSGMALSMRTFQGRTPIHSYVCHFDNARILDCDVRRGIAEAHEGCGDRFCGSANHDAQAAGMSTQPPTSPPRAKRRGRSASAPMSTREKRELVALARMPNSAINTGDIPEIADWTATWTGRFHRSVAKRRN